MPGLYILAGFSILPLVIWGIYAQGRVKVLFEKYSKQPVKKGVTGSRLARAMLNSAGLNDVVIEEVDNNLSDHYDPRQKIIRLSRNTARNASIASIGVAAHEASHAIQDGRGFLSVKLRDGIAPVVEKAGYFILPLLFVGVFIGRIIASSFFIDLAILLFFGIVIFYLLTLPIEFEASSRAMRYIKGNKIADQKELDGIQKVLKAAALTYIIAAALAVAQFLRLLGVYRRQ